MRLRTLKPGFFQNEDLAECTPLARILFAGLWGVADRAGRLEDRPKRIKAEVLPYDDCDVDQLLQELVDRRFIVRYQAGSAAFIQILTFAKHQNPHKAEAESRIPPPIEHPTGTVHAQCSTGDSTVPAENRSVPAVRSSVFGVLSLGSGQLGSGAEAPPRAAATTGPEAKALVDAFYEAIGVEPHSLTRSLLKRELSIAAQLVESGADVDEARRFVAWCRDGPYRPVPSDLRVYEQKRAQFLAGLEPVAAGLPGNHGGRRNGAVSQHDRELVAGWKP